jgi:MFS family permease
MTTTTTTVDRRAVLARVAVSGAYAAQGLGYATVVTALPAFKERQGIDDTAVSMIVLLVCVTAAGGSVLAERLSTRRGSRTAVLLGLALQAVALPLVALATPMVPFVAGFAIYGLGLGMVDASAGIQGVLVQHRYGRAVMSGFFACYTAAAIVGALVMSALVGAGSGPGAGGALVVAAVVLVGALLLGRPRLVGSDLRRRGPVLPSRACRGSASRPWWRPRCRRPRRPTSGVRCPPAASCCSAASCSPPSSPTPP